MDYRIDRIKFDVSFSDGEEARDLQDKFFSICRNGLVRTIEGVLEKSDVALSIEKLELDLGEMRRRDLDQKLLDELAEKLTEALQNLVEDLRIDQSSQRFQLEALTLYLEKGLKHWSDLGKMSFHNLFREVLSKSSGALFQFFVDSRYKEAIVARIIFLIDESDYRSLISKLRPAEASFILGFIADVKKVNPITPFSPATSARQLDQSLRELILLDLINEYGSAFNRRMFIERNLRALANEYNLSFLDLLNHFERVLNEEIPFEVSNTFPALIRTLSEKYHREEALTNDQLLDYGEVFQTLIELTGGLHPVLEESFDDILEEYSGELKSYLLLNTRTSDQVKSMVARLNENRLEGLITVIEPDEYEYILTYIRGAKGIAHSKLEHKSDQAMNTQIYEVVFGYLMIDRGSRFNQKAFLRYQLKGLVQTKGISYATILSLLRNSLANMGSVNRSSGMLSFLEEFLSEEETTISYEHTASERPPDNIVLVKEYLKSGAIPIDLRGQQQVSILKFLENSHVDTSMRSDLFEFFLTEQQKVLSSMVDFKPEEFEQIVRILLMERWDFTVSQSNQFVVHLRKIERQAVYPIGYRKVVFQLLISSSFKLTKTSQPLQKVAGVSGISEMLFYQLSEQLSLQNIMAHPDFQNTMDLNQRTETSFTKSRKRLLLAIQDTNRLQEPYEKAAIREAFNKIQESDIDTFSLLDHLKLEEVGFLFEHLEKQHYQKLIEQLVVGKWQILKKSLLLMVKGSTLYQPETSLFFAELYQKRHSNVNEVFSWINQSYQRLRLSKQYLKSIQVQQQKIQKVLDSDDSDSEEGTSISYELETLIKILSEVNLDTTEGNVASIVFNQLFIKDATALFRELRRLSFTSKESRRYVESLGSVNIEQWIRSETGTNHQVFVEYTGTVERLLVEVFRKERSISIDENKLLAIRLMLANRTGNYSLDFEQVLKFYLQELAEHSVFKYQLVQKWLFTGLKRANEQLNSWIPAAELAIIENEIRPAQEKERQSDREVLEKVMEKPEDLSSLSVPNAGLVLFWPFYKRLFSMLGYLNEEGGFKSIVEQSRAVRLLHHIGGLDWDDPEYNLTLNKILCGLPFTERMEPNLEISEKEIATVEEMLHSVIQHWDRLGNTSIEGLRDTFLRRSGILEKDDENWNLKVEKKGVDVLIDFMPWSYTSVVLSWMPSAMYVDWR